jgi:leucyl-tRNA synthetase
VDADVSSTESQVVDLAMMQASIKKFVDGVSIKKIIYVPGKILNIVIGK